MRPQDTHRSSSMLSSAGCPWLPAGAGVGMGVGGGARTGPLLPKACAAADRHTVSGIFHVHGHHEALCAQQVRAQTRPFIADSQVPHFPKKKWIFLQPFILVPVQHFLLGCVIQKPNKVKLESDHASCPRFLPPVLQSSSPGGDGVCVCRW